MDNYKRIVISGHGEVDVLHIVEDKLPEPGPGQVRVKVLAAGVGYSDVMAQHGGYPLAPRIPFTPGYDLAGQVDKVGKGVTAFEEGQHVAALNPHFGCYAEYALLPSELLVPFSPTQDPAEVVSLILNYLTAHCILHKKAKMKTGETVLVHAAAGGVGTALLQLGNLIGLTMYGTASEGKHAIVKAMGATPIDYQSEDFVDYLLHVTTHGVDAAFDSMGGRHLQRSYNAVRRGGRVVCYGFSGNHFGGLAAMIQGVLQMAYLNVLPNGKRVHLCATPGEVKKNNLWYKSTLTELLNLLQDKKITPLVGARVDLPDVKRAHALIEQGAVSGKVVLVCPR